MPAVYARDATSEASLIEQANQEGQQQMVSLEDALREGAPSPRLISVLESEFKASAQYREMVLGRRYFKCQNDIDNKKRTIMGEGGSIEEYPEGVVSNAKLKHPDFVTMVNQKVVYLFSRPFTIQCKDQGKQRVLESYFNDAVRATIKEGAKRAIYYGKCPFEVFYGQDGKMGVRVHHATETIPYWEDDEHTKLMAALRVHQKRFVTAKGDIREITQYEFYNQSGVHYYVRGKFGRVEADPSRGQGGWDANFYRDEPAANADGTPLYQTDPTTGQAIQPMVSKAYNFGELPILFFKYNNEESSLINFVKSLIDEYDEVSSNNSDELRDNDNSIKVIRGYNGESLGELVHNIRLFRAVSVQSDGGVESVDTKLDSQAYENHLTRLRKDMYSAGSCVDTTRVDNLGNQSGVAMRYIYSDLDMTSMEMWDSLESSVLLPLARFFLYDCYLKTGVIYDDSEIDFIPNTDIAVNETETVLNIKNSYGIISQETLISNHPYVTDARAELERVRKEREEMMELMGGDGIQDVGKSPKEITSRQNGAKSQG